MPDNTSAIPQEWRAAQHRMRNDLQTLASLVRLSRRRAPAQTLVDEFPAWLNALAAVYDVQPLWSNAPRVPADAIVQALRARGDLPVRVAVEGGTSPDVPAASCVAVALGVQALLTYATQAAGAGQTVQIVLRGDEDACRFEAVFRMTRPDPPEWPPFGLTLAVEAMDGQCATGQDGDDTVAVLVVPCR